MKIVCDSCGAKYSIADEKVAGRVFKIRCKKCGAAIVVRGDQVETAAEAEAAAPAAADYGGDAVWHMVIDGDQQGPFSPAQIGEMLSAGSIGWDAYVWKEGFDDWKPAQDVEELVSAVMGGAEGQAEEAEAGAGDMGADPFAATAAAASEPPGAADPYAAQAAVAPRDAGADLFAQTDTASPFGGAEEDDDLVASAPGTPRVSAEQALTGARNENSVLFSLSNLQALATGGDAGGAAPSGPSPMAPMASGGGGGGASSGMATGEGSGLIDIRALAAATGVTGDGSGPVTSASDDKVDDLLSIGGTGAGGLGSSLGAPVLVPEQREEGGSKGLMIGLAVAAVAIIGLLGALIVVLVTDDDPPNVVASGAVTSGETTAATAAPTTAAAAQPGTGTGTEPAPAAAGAGGDPAPAAGAGDTGDGEGEGGGDGDEAGEGGESASGSTGRRRRRRGGGGSAAAGGGGGSTAAAAPSGGGGGGRRGGGGGGSIDDLLDNALSGSGGGGGGGGRRGGGSGGGGGGAASGPAAPGRSDVVSAMNSVSGAVTACGNGAHGLAPVRIVFGSNGRVQSAQVSGGNFPGPVRSCIARAVRGARVPPFRNPTFSVNYPFRL